MQFTHPLVLLLLSLPLALLFYSLSSKTKSISSLFAPDVLKLISVHSPILNTPFRYRLFLLIVILFVIALARPVAQTQYQEQSKKSIPLVIALDISKSMLEDDFYPSRLEFALSKIEQIMHSEYNLRVGLLLFGSHAYVAHPLSEDKASLTFIAKNIEYSKIIEDKTDLFVALEGAEIMLQKYKVKNLLIISDLQNIPVLQEEIFYAQRKKLHVNILNITTQESPALTSLASKSGGVYQKALYSESDITSILSHLQSRDSTYRDTKEQKRELFYFPLILSLVLFFYIYLTSVELRYKSTNLLLLLLLSTSLQLKASPLESYYIYKAETAYKDMHYEEAIRNYTHSLIDDDKTNAKLYYNIGNSYVKLKQLHLAKKYYKKSLSLEQDIQTQENLAQVKLILSNQKHKKAKEKEDKYKLPQKISVESKEPQNTLDSSYRVRLESLVLNNEEKLMQMIQKQKPIIYLRKLNTQRSSKNVLQD